MTLNNWQTACLSLLVAAASFTTTWLILTAAN